MKEFFQNTVFFGVFISLFAYSIGVFLRKKTKLSIFNPLLIAILLTMGALLLLDVDYETYDSSAKYLSYLLTPATVSLAIPLYEQIELLKKNWKAVFAGIFTGVLASLVSVLLFALIFHMNHAEYVTFLPKSITTAIGMGVSEELGGYRAITVAVIIITGIIGNIFAELVCKIFRIREPIAVGIAIGSSSHALGTAKAMEIGDVEGAMSSLSIVVSGLLTVAGAMVFANFI
ncbi:MAG: LrgB family protein [Eubacterium sp.]|nr:LrgB family protein [Eubacterium sp.]